MTNEASPTQPNSGNNKGFKNALFKSLVPLVVILALAVVGLQVVKYKLNSTTTSRENAPEGAQVAQIGKILPDMELKTLDGKTQKVSELGAKVVLLNFWATWCEACMVEMPSIVQLNHLYQDKGLKVVAVNLDEKPEAVVPKAIRQLKIDFQVYKDPDSALTNLFDVHAIPLTIIMDKDRKILHVEGGERDWTDAEMKTKMNQWLGL